MKVHVEELSPIERKLSIEVPPELVREELERAYTQLSRQVKIAGFRPGKVPRRILEQRYKDQVEDDVIQRVVQRSYLTAIAENNVPAVSSPSVTNPRLVPDAPFKFEARVEVKPKVEPREYKELPLKKEPVEVPDAEVDTQLKQLQERASRLEPVEGRTRAASGDFAVVDIDGAIDGKPFPGSHGEDITVQVSPGELVESRVAALEGTEVGHVKELDYAFAPDYRVPDVAGKVAHFKLTLKSLKAHIVPPLDDAFAKEIGAGVDTLEALRAKVRGDLESAATHRAAGAERDALLATLVERNPFEVPPAMVERAVDMMLDGALRQLQRSGVDPRMLNLDFEGLRSEMRERAVREVKGSLLLEAIATQEKIAAEDADLEMKMQELAEESGQPISSVRKHFRRPEERESLAMRVREEKTIEFLKAAAKYS